MQFAKSRRPEPYEVTPRIVAAFERRKVKERESFPLFAEEIAASQPATVVEMARRSDAWDRWERDRRSQMAKHWLEVRERVYALPPHIRSHLKIEFARSRGPKDVGMLASHIWRVAGELGAAPEDFPHLSPADRCGMTAALNDRARRDDPWTRCTREFSPEAMRWLAPGWTASEEYPEPRLHLHTSQKRYMRVWWAIARFEAFGGVHSDPSGERREGSVIVDGTALAFTIHYLRPTSDQACPTPWNADLSRRVIYVRRAGEFASFAPAAS